MVKKLEFSFSPSPASNNDQVRVHAGRDDILRMQSRKSIGLDPPAFFRQESLIRGGGLHIGRCSCGVMQCDDYDVQVEIDERFVRWSLPAGQEATFSKDQYSSAIEAARKDTSWATAGERLDQTEDSK